MVVGGPGRPHRRKPRGGALPLPSSPFVCVAWKRRKKKTSRALPPCPPPSGPTPSPVPRCNRTDVCPSPQTATIKSGRAHERSAHKVPACAAGTQTHVQGHKRASALANEMDM